MASPGNEVEVKIRLPNDNNFPDRLQTLGFRITVPRDFESNTIYDSDDESLRDSNMLLRLRQIAGKKIVTWKGPEEPGPHKDRPELETTVGSLETLAAIFDKLGYKPRFRYEKYRTEFRHPAHSAGVVTFDETPIGNFAELEGPGEWIDSTAAALGFTADEYVLQSYSDLYRQHCEDRGMEPANMVFAS